MADDAAALQARVARLAEKAPGPREEVEVAPLPGREPGGYVDVRFRRDGDHLVLVGVFDPAGVEKDDLLWFALDEERVLRVPFAPGGRLPETPVEQRRTHRKDTAAAKAAGRLEWPTRGQNSLRAVLSQFTEDFKGENRGITDEELAIRMGKERGQVGPRRLDLVNQGWLVARGKRQGRTGAENTVYTLSDGALKKMGLRRTDG